MSKIRRGTDEIIFDIINGLFLTVLSVLFLYPLVYVFSASVSKPIHLMLGEVILLPKGFTFDSYTQAAKITNLWLSYWNTLHITVIGTLINMVLTICGAYVLSKPNLKGRKVLTLLVIVTMWFDPGMIPRYLNFRDLHLLNSFFSITLGFGINTFNLIILKTFFESVPASLEESARIDGASQYSVLRNIYLPLSGSALTTVALFYAVSRWNGYFWTMILLADDKKAPLQVLLKNLIVTKNMAAESGPVVTSLSTYSPDTIIYAVIVISILPVLIVYPYVQKFFKKGVALGAVKG